MPHLQAGRQAGREKSVTLCMHACMHVGISEWGCDHLEGRAGGLREAREREHRPLSAYGIVKTTLWNTFLHENNGNSQSEELLQIQILSNTLKST